MQIELLQQLFSIHKRSGRDLCPWRHIMAALASIFSKEKPTLFGLAFSFVPSQFSDELRTVLRTQNRIYHPVIRWPFFGQSGHWGSAL